MGICNKCKGSGNLAVFITKGFVDVQRKLSFRKCNRCSGKGTSHAPLGPAIVHIHNRRKVKHGDA
jgi:DnaJ-class molecular chaperone